MSSFVGLLHLDGAPAAPQILAAMLGRLSHRVTPEAQARASIRTAGPVGLGCAVLASTPQARLELENPDAQQLTRQGSAELWIASDARLDNRDELIGALGVQSQARSWSDGRLILAAYEKWGQECAARLRGDFAFAIWDGRQKRLFCARDIWGVKPFYYAHLPGQLFAFASEVKALWCVPGLEARVNPTQIAGYLAGRFQNKTSTFYLQAQRLSPACWMRLAPDSREQAREQLYWELDGHSELDLPLAGRARDEAYADLVRAALDASVRERMRCDGGRLAVFLSGGLDSSSIAALAERALDDEAKPLTTLSTIFDRFPECDERFYMKQTLARGAFDPIWMNGDAISPFDGLERIMWHLDGPSPGPNLCSSWAQYGLLQDAGVRVVLDGHGGDEIVFMGYARVGELLRQGRFSTAWNELRLLRRYQVIEAAPSAQVWSAMLWHARDKRGWGRLSRAWQAQQTRRQRSAPSRAESDETAQLNAASLDILTPQCRDWLEQDAPPAGAGSVRAQHVHDITGALQPLALEGIDAASGAHAIDTRCAFWERELAQLCVSLPSDQKLRYGHNRYVMRRAMQGLLAPDVQWRTNKTNFGPQIATLLGENAGPAMEQFFQSWEDATAGRGTSIADYVDLDVTRAHWQALQEAPPGSAQAALPTVVLWKVFSLGLWLAAQPPSPSAP